MDVTLVVGVSIVVVLAFVAGILVAPKAAKYEAAFEGEIHALYQAGALDAEHVKAWFETKLAGAKAEVALKQNQAANAAVNAQVSSTQASRAN